MRCTSLLLPRIKGAVPKPTKACIPVFTHVSLVSHYSTEQRPGILVLNAGSSSLKFNLFSLNENVTSPINSVTSVLSGVANGEYVLVAWCVGW